MALNRKFSPDYPDGLYLVDGGELVTDRYGLSSAEAVWEYAGTSSVLSVSPTIGEPHPDYSFLALDLRRISKAGGKYLIRGSYYGVDGTPDAVYSLRLATSEEPIETHKEFATFGVTGNGAYFDAETGEFIGFTDKTKPEWFGVTSYLAPGAVFSETVVRSTQPDDLSYVGKIAVSLPLPFLSIGGRSWLFIGMDYEQKGSCFTITRSWRLSGTRGWNTTIYA